MKQILLNSGKSLRESNVDNKVQTELFTEQKLLPTGSLSATVDAYEEYIKEKDSSDVYRLLFTINPVCSNILFNALTDIVYKEGSLSAMMLSYDDSQDSPLWKYAELKDYARKYKGLNSTDTIKRVMAIRDTAFSHPNLGNLSYHCGLDIFNNHTLRGKQFAVVNDGKTNEDIGRNGAFNTLGDYMRDSGGEIVKESVLKMLTGRTENEENVNTAKTKMHLYTIDSTESFQKTVNDKLVERDGWVGFINPSSLNIQNVTIGENHYTVNKCINNRDASEFIDMYPDRTLYSFIPKVNNYRKRIEKNWDYCLTYPAESVFDNPIVCGNGGVNGIKCKVLSLLRFTIFDNVENAVESDIVYLRTQVKNTFVRGTHINISVINNGTVFDTFYPITVESIGMNGDDGAHIFSVRVGDLYNVFSRFVIDENNKTFLDDDGFLLDDFEIRVRKFTNGVDCKYYLRKFKKLPEYGSTINKVAFSENIFSDKIAQILYNDDIVTTGIKDNLGRSLSEIFLTIIKRNAGYREWLNGNYSSENVEFSHCFGNITSGLDLVPEEDDYNIHKLHNNQAQTPSDISYLESDITIDNDEFLGDVVEFAPYTLVETVLENVLHRFNTIQRELGKYSSESGNQSDGVKYDDISYDDYDMHSGFTITEKKLPISYFTGRACIEGYYYKPHYRVPLRQYSIDVQQGNHRKLAFSSAPSGAGMSFSAVTSINYYLYPGDTLYIYDKKNGNRIEGEVISTSGRNFTEITFVLNNSVEDISKYSIFKKNPIMPDDAYDLMDASGRYLWKEKLSDSALIPGDELYDSIFTNGANYRHLKINFYLRRQDPTGEYMLNTGETIDAFSGVAEGKIKNIEDVEYVSTEEGTVC